MYIEIDARGLACPKPVINTKKELDNIEQGIVIVTVDNDVAKQNILKQSTLDAFCKFDKLCKLQYNINTNKSSRPERS